MKRSQLGKTSKGIMGLMLGAGLLLSVGCPDESGSGGSGDPHVNVFLSSATYDGFIAAAGGLGGADGACQTLALTEGLPENYRAWLSDSTGNAIDRIFDGDGASFRLANGTIIADNWADLIDGTLDAPINLDEGGNDPGGTSAVWTATDLAGTLTGTHCSDWSSASNGDNGLIGEASATDATWTDVQGSNDCDQERRLYCFAESVTN
jgi:hypothetical protein